MLVLGIETSCDETALALVADGRQVLGTQVVSSLKAHQRFGGVVPEIASRVHVEVITAELELLLSHCRVAPGQIDRIAVTRGPGLAGALSVGVAAARVLGLVWGKPVFGVNHLQAHLYAATMGTDAFTHRDPMIGLAISGGHTAIIRMEGLKSFELLGQTRDDAVGEAFDKVAKLLGLGFPGGPEIQRVSAQGNPKAFSFSVPKIKSGTPYDFSLSGIKTAVLYKVREYQKGVSGQGSGVSSLGSELTKPYTLNPEFVADMAASFQYSIVEEVAAKVLKACRNFQIRRLAVGGGVIANACLRERLQAVCAQEQVALAIPDMALCTDNGAMVAGLGEHLDAAASNACAVEPNLPVGMN